VLWAQSHYNNNLAPAKAFWPWLLDYLGNMADQAASKGGIGNLGGPYGDW
jgi:hypothetical protein